LVLNSFLGNLSAIYHFGTFWDSDFSQAHTLAANPDTPMEQLRMAVEEKVSELQKREVA